MGAKPAFIHLSRPDIGEKVERRKGKEQGEEEEKLLNND